MRDFFEEHWNEWLADLRIPCGDMDSTAADDHLYAALKQSQLNALQACLAFHLQTFPEGTTAEMACRELNQGRFYSLASHQPGLGRTARQAAGSIFRDVILAAGCWVAGHSEWHVCQLYRTRFQDNYYFGWSDWIGSKPHGLDYLQRRGNGFFERFCGVQPVLKRPRPYISEFIGAWDLRTHLALLTQGDYSDFLAKNRGRLPLSATENLSVEDPPAEFENDECCQKAAAKLIAAIRDDLLGVLTDDELSLVYLFLLGEESPHEVLARLTDRSAATLRADYERLQERIRSRLRDAITLHKFRCPCLKHFMGNPQSRGRCRCLAYAQHADWFQATHERLFRGQHLHLLQTFARQCDAVLNHQRL